MNTRDIEHFLAVADSRTLSAAAQQLRIAQPTLTKSIARLERALGSRLFERTARGVALTESGRVFATHARDIHARLEDSSSAMRDLRSGRAGVVRIGLGIGIPQALVAATFGPLMRQGMTVEVIGGTPGTFATASTTVVVARSTSITTATRPVSSLRSIMEGSSATWTFIKSPFISR